MRTIVAIVAFPIAVFACSSSETTNTTIVVTPDGGDSSVAPVEDAAIDSATPDAATDSGGDVDAAPMCKKPPSVQDEDRDCDVRGPCDVAGCTTLISYACHRANQAKYGRPKGLVGCIDQPSGDISTYACCASGCVERISTLCGVGPGYACPTGVAPPKPACSVKSNEPGATIYCCPND